MRINRIARPITLAASLAGAWIASTVLAQTPGGPSPSTPGQAPAANAPAVPGGPQAEKPEEPPTEAETVIDEAIKKIAGIKAVSADLTQDVRILGQKFQIKGRYIKAPSARIYLRLDVSGLPGAAGTMLQVCDGDVLWDYQKILDAQSYRKLSVKPILQRLESPEIDANLREQILSSLGFTGPEALLAGVRKAVKFDAPKEEGELDGKAVWILKGGWRDRTGIVAPNQTPIPGVGMLPPYIPSFATLYLDKQNGWPYKLDLRGRLVTSLIDTRQVGIDGKKIGAKSSIEKQDPSELTLTYTNIQFEPTLTDADFAFQAPPDANVEDNTEIILKSLDQAIEFQALQKRTEAANAAGSVLQQPIEVPAAPPAAEIPK
ncbi:LolA family protein [Planctomyces sp. SH-PL62]|uniref:LolA family protein n=1 Tax=Planctomyces sp. SH-PL62 TaxID=1636152 RepID=UPI00078BE49D|nr:hypothetical protein [Planctomyces sp. SH-PL62]AMV38642.1 hypothetical protein VT85_14485 [Planctomyces sp. SH-PL62]